MNSQRSAFSLIELVTVLTIIGLVIATVSLNWLAPLREAQFSETIRKIQSIDQQTRLHARSRLANTWVEFEIGNGKVRYSKYSNQGKESTLVYQLPNDHQVVQIKTATQKISQGVFRYPINQFGISESIAIQIADGNRNQWVVILGGTGQSKAYDDESQFEIAIEQAIQ